MEEKAFQEERSPAFDFDEWCELARKNPEKFEEKRQKVIDKFIISASPAMQKRLRQLQWRIDMERKRCKSPMMSCMKIYDMMWDFVHAERGFLYAVNLLDKVTAGGSLEVEDIRPAEFETEVLAFQVGRR